MIIIFSADCCFKQQDCPNTKYISSKCPDSHTMCLANENDITQNRILRAQLTGNMFQCEPKFNFNDFFQSNGESSDDVQAKQPKQPEAPHSEHQPSQRNKFQNPIPIPSRRSLSTYELGM